MPAAALDSALQVETPEGILLSLRPAGLHARLNAWLLDLLLRAGVLYIVTLVAAQAGILGVTFWLIAAFLLEWFYPVAFELSALGATPGKRLLGLRVVMDDGMPLTAAASFTRNLLRAADFLPVLYSSAVLCMLWRGDFKRLGDMVASTLVVHVNPPPAPRYAQDVPPLAPLRPLSPRARAALVAIAARAGRTTAERLDELATIAAPVCGIRGTSGPELTRQVLGVGLYLLGRHA